MLFSWIHKLVFYIFPPFTPPLSLFLPSFLKTNTGIRIGVLWEKPLWGLNYIDSMLWTISPRWINEYGLLWLRIYAMEGYDILETGCRENHVTIVWSTKKKIGDVEATPAMSSSSRRGVSHSTPRRNAASIESGNALNGVGAAPLPPPTASSRPTSSQSSGATFRRPSKEALSLSLSGASLSSAKKVGSPDSLLLYANALIEFVWLIDWLIDRLRI